MSLGRDYGAWLAAMHHDPDATGVTLEELRGEDMKLHRLPKDLDYKIVRGFEGSKTITIVVFSKKLFEKTGCEFESEVFRVEITNTQGTTDIVVTEEQTTNVTLF